MTAVQRMAQGHRDKGQRPAPDARLEVIRTGTCGAVPRSQLVGAGSVSGRVGASDQRRSKS